MKIVCLSFWFYDYTIQLANALSKRETVLLILPDNIGPEYKQAIGEKVIPFYVNNLNHPYLFSFSIVYQILNRIKSFHPDIIHFQVSRVLLIMLLPFLRKYPLVGTFHDAHPHIGEEMFISEILNKFCIRYSDMLFVHGKELKQQIIKEYKVKENKVHEIYLPEHEVFPFKIYEKDIEENENYILFFGRIWEYKGLEYLIKAEPLITREVPTAKIVIAGTGENFFRYENMMKNKNNFVVYNRYISYMEGAELFQRCSIVVLPYIEASQSGVVHPAYGFKKPVVVTNVGSIPEIVDDGVTGFIVPPKDSRALAEAIIKLLKDEKLRKKMGENAYFKLKNDLSWENAVEKTIEIYSKAINKSG